jgi:hypothetical protein
VDRKMKGKHYICILFSLHTLSCVSWGYHGGPAYDLVETKDVYLHFEDKKIYLVKTPGKKVSISFYNESKVLFEEIYSDSIRLKSPYRIPDELIFFSRQKNMKIELRIDDEWYYQFNLIPFDWGKKEQQYAQLKKFKRN